MKYKAVIFDLDGTLVNSLEDLATSGNELRALYQKESISIPDYRYIVGNGSRVMVERLLPDINTEGIDEALEKYKQIYEKNYLKTTRPYDGIKELIKGLKNKGIKIAVFTNKHISAAKAVIDKSFDKKTFDYILGDEPGIEKKPNPMGALLIAQKWGISPNEIIFVGDTKMDMITGVKAKMFPVGVLWGFRTKEELLENGAQIIINRPEELLEKID